jgi:hypothetical protein
MAYSHLLNFSFLAGSTKDFSLEASGSKGL